MSNYRRTLLPGGTFFFTVVTLNRQPFLTDENARIFLRQAIYSIREKHPFSIDAFCLLPDHLHCLWTLPEDDANYPLRWRLIKGLFSHLFLSSASDTMSVPASKLRRGEVGIWQRRYWEHSIRNEEDFQRHFDYTHYNLVKHGLAQKPAEWPWSTFHKYKRLGFYEAGWGELDWENFEAGAFGE